MFKISHQLRLRILDVSKAKLECHMTPIEVNFRGVKHKVPGITWNELILDLNDSPELFDECENWLENRRSQFDCKLNMGEYDGMFPSICDRSDMSVTFLVDSISFGRKNWRDWFMEGEEHASQ